MGYNLKPWVKRLPLWLVLGLAWLIAFPINLIFAARRTIVEVLRDTSEEIDGVKKNYRKGAAE